MGGTIGKYEVRGALGSGAYGTVYLGWQEDLQRPVAIKELGAQMVSDPAFLEGFREEARIMALLDHPNCVKVFDFIELGGRAFLVSEFVDGASLRQVVVDAGSLTPQQALGVLKGSITGLGHAHHLGLTHRDVKPENILADREGTSKLADFGQAYFGAGPGAAGALTGSPPYMSPEQARGGVCDARSDLYSAGCILYEFLTGRPPFLADNAMAVMRMQVSEVAVDPRKVNKKLPKQATKLMARALAKDPAARFQSADEMLSELEDTARAGYGKNWEQSAAIKGLVAASAAGAAVAAGAVGVAAAGATAGATGTAAVGTTTVGAASTTAAAGGGISGTTIAAGAGVAALAGAAAVAYVVISNAVFGHNLVTNGNAEQGSGATTSAAVVRPNGWTTTGNFTVVKYGADVFPSASDPGPPDRGDYFFAGGNGPTASASQTLDVSGGGGAIDSGGKKYTLSAWLGGYGGQNDNATVEATFLSANGQAIGTPARIGPVTDIVRGGKTALKLAQTTGEIPKGTRKVLLKVLLVRTEGNYNDGYADDITFSIS